MLGRKGREGEAMTGALGTAGAPLTLVEHGGVANGQIRGPGARPGPTPSRGARRRRRRGGRAAAATRHRGDRGRGFGRAGEPARRRRAVRARGRSTRRGSDGRRLAQLAPGRSALRRPATTARRGDPGLHRPDRRGDRHPAAAPAATRLNATPHFKERRSSAMAGTTHPTLYDIPESTRGQVIDLLNQRLADAIDLQLQTKQAHWNVKGPQFIALHKRSEERRVGKECRSRWSPY